MRFNFKLLKIKFPIKKGEDDHALLGQAYCVSITDGDF